MTNAHLLIADDSETRRALLSRDFRASGYQVSQACDGLEAIQQIIKTLPDLILIDQDMPNLTGMEVIEWMRGAEVNIPAILMTGYDSEELHTRCLKRGSDDYLRLPVSFSVMLAHVEARLRLKKWRSSPDISEELHFADVAINLHSHAVHRGTSALELTPTEYRLLVAFLRHPLQVLTRDQLIEQAWGPDFAGEVKIVDQYVKALRRKLEAHDGKRIIYTAHGFGYVLRAFQDG